MTATGRLPHRTSAKGSSSRPASRRCITSSARRCTCRATREARDRLQEGMKQYPDRPAFVHALVRLLAAAPDAAVRDGQAALALMRDVLAREPRGVEVGELMAMTQAELGQFGEAVTWQREALAAADRVSRPDLVRRLTDAVTR